MASCDASTVCRDLDNWPHSWDRKETCRQATPSRGDSCRRRPADPQQVGRGATLPRCDLPASSTAFSGNLTAEPTVTRRFPRRPCRRDGRTRGLFGHSSPLIVHCFLDTRHEPGQRILPSVRQRSIPRDKPKEFTGPGFECVSQLAFRATSPSYAFRVSSLTVSQEYRADA